MTVRITTESGATLVHVAGDLMGEDVAELERACASIEGSLVIDVAGLRRVDARGIEAIRALEERGARLVNVSPFLELRLRPRRAQGGENRAK